MRSLRIFRKPDLNVTCTGCQPRCAGLKRCAVFGRSGLSPGTRPRAAPPVREYQWELPFRAPNLRPWPHPRHAYFHSEESRIGKRASRKKSASLNGPNSNWRLARARLELGRYQSSPRIGLRPRCLPFPTRRLLPRWRTRRGSGGEGQDDGAGMDTVGGRRCAVIKELLPLRALSLRNRSRSSSDSRSP
jgi:hypothetical protein